MMEDLAEATDAGAKNGASYTEAVTDPVEERLGIQTYLNPDAGFVGVSKARFSDFLVHEVNPSGSIAYLTDLTETIYAEDGTKVPLPSGKTDDDATVGQKRKAESGVSSEEPEKKKTAMDDDAVKEELGQLLGRTCDLQADVNDQAAKLSNKDEWIAEILKFGKAEVGNPDYKVLNIPLLSSTDKLDRATWHKWLKASPFAENIATDTFKKESTDSSDEIPPTYLIRIWYKDFAKEMPGYKNYDPRRGNKHRQNQPKPDKPYLQFVLYKENMDTSTAINQVQRTCGPPGINGRGRGGRGRGGRQHRLRLGHAGMKDKRGVTCQFLTVPSTTPVRNLMKLNHNRNHARGGGHTQKGGVAMVRVGNFSYVNNELRLGRLQGNRFNLVLRNLQLGQSLVNAASESSLRQTRKTLRDIVARSAEALSSHGFINYFGTQRFGKSHDTHLSGVAVLQGNFQKAIDIILQPKPDANDLPDIQRAREGWINRFEGKSQHEYAGAEKKAAEQLLRECGRFMNSERALCESLSRNPLEYKRAYETINKTMRMMFVHAWQSLVWNHLASYRIENFVHRGKHGVIEGDFVLESQANSGTSEGSSSTEDGQLPEIHVVSAEEAAKNKFKLDQVVLPVVGSKTKLPEYARQVFDSLLGKYQLTTKAIQDFKDRDFSCQGDYRKLICRPKDVKYEILEYDDPLEPLVQTEMMKIDDIELAARKFDETKHPCKLMAAQIEFTLPSSAYATIALRELMKRPTSTEYQSELKLESNGDVKGEDSKVESKDT